MQRGFRGGVVGTQAAIEHIVKADDAGFLINEERGAGLNLAPQP